MVKHPRRQFNRRYTEERYGALLAALRQRCGTEISFRVAETPVFLPTGVLQLMLDAGNEILRQTVQNPSYLKESERSIPPELRVPDEPDHPLFASLDFALVEDSEGRPVPRLIELQGFPSLYAYQVALAEEYIRAYSLDPDLEFYLSGLTQEQYGALLRKAIVGDHDPECVVLLEIDPAKQKTLPDFLLTERAYGITTVNIRDLVREGDRIFYKRSGSRIPIERIYNRVIAEDLARSGVVLPFQFTERLEVEWAGHPNWFFRLSKFSLPYLSHQCIPETRLLSSSDQFPRDVDNWVLKPLFSFAGSGVKVGPSQSVLQNIPAEKRDNYVLQKRVSYGDFIETPDGFTRAEVRVMYIWIDNPVPVITLIRLARGQMMGVDHNKNMRWVGSSAAFFVNDRSDPTP
jgi:hypothetical protein